MNKQEFLIALGRELSCLPQEDAHQSMEYYGEMVDDRMEDGLTEEEAVAAIGSVEEIAAQILAETTVPTSAEVKGKSRRNWRTWEIILLVVGSPVWLPLLAAAAIVLAAILIVIWSVIISLFAIDLFLAVGGVASVLTLALYLPAGHIAPGVTCVGVGLFCEGLALLLFLGSRQTAKALMLVCRKLLLGAISVFKKKKEAV